MTHSLVTFDDGAEYFEQQANKEKHLVNELKNHFNVPNSLFTKHSIEELVDFFHANHERIDSRYFYLYPTTAKVFTFPWCAANQVPLKLGNAFYVLFNRDERDSAIRSHGQSKGKFL